MSHYCCCRRESVFSLTFLTACAIFELLLPLCMLCFLCHKLLHNPKQESFQLTRCSFHQMLLLSPHMPSITAAKQLNLNFICLRYFLPNWDWLIQMLFCILKMLNLLWEWRTFSPFCLLYMGIVCASCLHIETVHFCCGTVL